MVSYPYHPDDSPEPENPQVWQPGARLNGAADKLWQLGEILYQGGQSEIWELAGTEGGSGYVAKAYRPFSSPFVANDRLEILQIISSTASTKILRSCDFLIHGKVKRLVEIMPRCDMTLREFWDAHNRGCRDQDSAWIALKIVNEVAEALRDLHRMGFVHCDVSADNIFVNGGPNDFQVLLADFGTADYLNKKEPVTESEQHRHTSRERGEGRPVPRVAPSYYWWADKQARGPDDYFQLGLVILELFGVNDAANIRHDSRAGYFHRQIQELPRYIQKIAVGFLNGDPSARLDFEKLGDLSNAPELHPRMYRSILQPSREAHRRFASDELRPYSIATKIAKDPSEWARRRDILVQRVIDWLSTWSTALENVPAPRSVPPVDEDLPRALLQLERRDLKTAWKAVWMLDRSIPFRISGHPFHTFGDLARFIEHFSVAEGMMDAKLEKDVATSLKEGILQAWIEQMLHDPGAELPAWCEDPRYPVADFLNALDQCVASIQRHPLPPDVSDRLYWLALRYCYHPDDLPPSIGNVHADAVAHIATRLMRYIDEADQLRRSGRISVWLDAVSWRKQGKLSDFGLDSKFWSETKNPALTSYLALRLGSLEKPSGKVTIEGDSHIQPDMIRHGERVTRTIRLTNTGSGCLAGVVELRHARGRARFRLTGANESAREELTSQWQAVESASGGQGGLSTPPGLTMPFMGNDSVIDLEISQGPRSSARESTVELHIHWNGEQGECNTKVLLLRFGVIINYGKMVSFTLGALVVGTGLFFTIIFAALKSQRELMAGTVHGALSRGASGIQSMAEFNPLGPFTEGGGTEASFYPLVLTSLTAIVLMIVAVWFCCLKDRDP